MIIFSMSQSVAELQQQILQLQAEAQRERAKKEQAEAALRESRAALQQVQRDDADKLKQLFKNKFPEDVCSVLRRSNPSTLLSKFPNSWEITGTMEADICEKIYDHIEKLVTQDEGTNARENHPFLYIRNPPRHGKSLCLDLLYSGHGTRPSGNCRMARML